MRKYLPGQDHGMPAMPTLFWKAEPFGIYGTEIENGLERFATDVRLIAKNDHPMREVRSPAAPLCGAPNRAKHAALRRNIQDSICCRKTEAIEIGLDEQVIRRAHNCDLFGLESLPLVEQMAEHGGCTPGQQQLGPAHALRTTGGEQDGGEADHCAIVTTLQGYNVS